MLQYSVIYRNSDWTCRYHYILNTAHTGDYLLALAVAACTIGFALSIAILCILNYTQRRFSAIRYLNATNLWLPW